MKSNSEQDQNELNKSNNGPAKPSSNGITIVDKAMAFAIIGLLVFIVIAVAAKIMGMFLNMDVGFFLKKIRKERYHTLKDVALHIGLTPSLVSQIENGKTSPSLSSLDALLKYYKTSLTDFFKQIGQKDHIYLSNAEVETIDYDHSGARLSLLASKLHKNVMESYIVELSPAVKIDIHSSTLINDGERFIFILSGSLEAAVENEIILMNNGDSLNFKSHLPCQLCNISVSENCKILITGTPDIF